jgi:hypothetical protein
VKPASSTYQNYNSNHDKVGSKAGEKNGSEEPFFKEESIV